MYFFLLSILQLVLAGLYVIWRMYFFFTSAVLVPVFFCWDRYWMEAAAFWIFDILCCCSCILCSLKGLFCVCQLCCCVLLWLAVVLILSLCVNLNPVSDCVRAPLLFFSSKPGCWSRQWRHEDMPLGVNSSFCITWVFGPERCCKKQGFRWADFYIRVDYLWDSIKRNVFGNTWTSSGISRKKRTFSVWKPSKPFGGKYIVWRGFFF